MKKLFVLTLCVILLCLMSVVAAGAEDTGWLTELLPDGTACVTGYEGPAVESLTVPLTVDGHPVTAIKDGALFDLQTPTVVTIPQRVTHIGRDALPLSATVEGWSGTCALAYAAANGLNVKNLSAYDYVSDVVDMTGVPVSISGSTITLSRYDAAALEPGRLAVMSETDDMLDMRAYRVLSVAADGDEAVLEVRQVEGLSAVNSYSITFDHVNVDPVQEAAGDPFAWLENSKDNKVSLNYKINDNASMNVSFKVNTYVDGWYDYKLSNLPNGEFTVTSEMTVDAKLTGKLTLDQMANKVMDLVVPSHKEYHPTDIAKVVFAKTGFFDISGSVSMVADASLVGDMSYSLKKVKVIRVNNGLMETVREDVIYDDHPEFKIVGKASLGFKLNLGLNLLLGSSLSIGNSTTIDLEVKPAHQYDSSMTCYDGSISLNSGFNITAHLGIKAGPASWTFKDVTIPYGPQMHLESELTRFHVEFRPLPQPGQKMLAFLFYPQTCSVLPRDRYTIRFHTCTQQEIDDAYSKSGQKVVMPADPLPTHPTIWFVGWTTDSEGKVPFDAAQVLPEPPADQMGENIIDLWAHWSQPCYTAHVDLNVKGWEPVDHYVQPYSYLTAPEVPLRKNYRFLGFSATSTDQTSYSDAEWDFATDPMPECNINIIANWRYEEGYDPFEELLDRIENDEELQNRMFTDASFTVMPSTGMQGLGAYSRNDNWRVLNDLIEYTSYAGDSSVVVIPSKIGGCPVVWVDGAAWPNKDAIQQIVLPSTVSYISGFSGFKNLQAVIFRDEAVTYTGRADITLKFEGCETIADNCFKDCPNLTMVRFPSYIHRIGENAFRGTKLESVELGGVSGMSLGANAFSHNSNLKRVDLPSGCYVLPAGIFDGCTQLSEITGLEYIQYFGLSALSGTKLKTVDLNQVVSMESHVFTNCDELESIYIQFVGHGYHWADIENLPSLLTVRTVGGGFLVQNAPKLYDYSISRFIYNSSDQKGSIIGTSYACWLAQLPSLKNISVTDSLIPELKIGNCPELETLYLGEDKESERGYGTDRCSVTLENLPKLRLLTLDVDPIFPHRINFDNIGVSRVDLSAMTPQAVLLSNMPAMTELRLSELPTQFTNTAYVYIENCPALTGFTVPAGQTALSGDIENCGALRKVILPDSMTSMNLSLTKNSALSYVQLPNNDTVSHTGISFADCPALTELRIPSAWRDVDLDANSGFLYGLKASRLVIPDGVTVTNVNKYQTKAGSSLFVIETPQGSAAWQALQGSRWTVVPAGSGMRAVRYRVTGRYKAFELEQLHESFELSDCKFFISLYEPGATIKQPEIIPYSKSETVLSVSAGGRAFSEYRTMPDTDLTVDVTLGEPEVTPQYTLLTDGIRLTEYRTGTQELVIPYMIDGYRVTEIDPAVYTAGDYTDITLPGSLISVSGEDFKDCDRLIAIHGSGDSFMTRDGVLYAVNAAGKPVRLICCPRGYEGQLTLPGTVTAMDSWSVADVAGLSGLSLGKVRTIAEHTVTGDNKLSSLIFPATLTRIAADNFVGTPVQDVTFASDPVIDTYTFGRGTMTAFYGPVGAANLTAWADGNSLRYNLYSLSLYDGESVNQVQWRAGDSLDALDPADTETRLFLGWALTAPDGETAPALTDTMPESDTALYAVWEELYTVSGTRLDRVSEKVGVNVQVPYGVKTIAAGAVPFDAETVSIPCTVTSIKDGAFASVGKIIADNSTAAKTWAEANGVPFERALYSLSFIVNGGEPVADKQYYRNVTLALPTPGRAFAVFDGWYLDEALTEPMTLTKMPGYDLTLYAAWTLTGDDMSFSWTTLEDGTLALTGYRGTSYEPVIPASIDGVAVTAIADYAFAGNSAIVRLTVPQSVVSVGAHAFDGASSLTVIRFEGSDVTLGEAAFARCVSLRDVTLPAQQKVLPDRLFAGATALSGIDLPDTVTTMGARVFDGCVGLTALTLPKALRNFDALTLVNVPLKHIAIAEDASGYKSDGTALYTATMKSVCYVVPTAASCVIPDTVITIAAHALRDCYALKELTLPAGLRNIRQGAFEGCGIRSLTVPSGVSTIETGAFARCPDLALITIPDTVRTIGENIFGMGDPLIMVPSETGTPYKTLSGQYTVVAADEYVPLTGLTLAETQVFVGETITVQPVFEPADATDRRFELYYNDPAAASHKVAIGRGGTLTGLASGSEQLWAVTPGGVRTGVTVSVNTRPYATGIGVSTKRGLYSGYGYYKSVNGVHYTTDGTVYLEALPKDSYAGNSIRSVVMTTDHPELVTQSSSWSQLSFKAPASGMPWQDVTVDLTVTRTDDTVFTQALTFRVFNDADMDFMDIVFPESLTMYQGDLYALSGYRDGMFDTPMARALDVRFVSNDPSVVCIEQNRIRAVGPGIATVSLNGDTNKSVIVHVLKSSVTLNAEISSELIFVGRQGTITASVSGGSATIEYSSDDESVATVDSTGTITAVSGGLARVRVRAVSSGEIAAERTFLVACKVPYTAANLKDAFSVYTTPRGQVYGTPIEYSKNLISCATGESGADYETIEYASSDESVFTVTGDGYLKPVSIGSAVLSARVLYTGKTETLTVYVDHWSATVIALEEKEFTLPVGGKKALFIDVQPAQDGLRPSFTSGDESVVTVDSAGVVTAVGSGSTEVTVGVVNSLGAVIAEGWNGVTYTVHVPTQDEAIALTGLPKTVSMTVGETRTVVERENIVPQTAYLRVYYDSISVEDPRVIQCEDGSSYKTSLSVTALRPGTTRLTIDLERGGAYTITVNVAKPDVYGAIGGLDGGIAVGGTAQLTVEDASAPGGYTVQWASSDASVAKVTSAGLLTAVKAGSATVSLTVRDKKSGVTYRDDMAITVEPRLAGFAAPAGTIAYEPQYVWGYRLPLTAADSADDKEALAARTTVLSQNGYAYQVRYGDMEDEYSSDESNYSLFLFMDGTSMYERPDRITLVTDNYDSQVRRSFTLYFDRGMDDLSLNEVTVGKGENYELRRAIDTYGQEAMKQSWTSGDSTVAKVNADGTLTGVAEGSTTLTATLTGHDGRKMTAETTVTVTDSAVTSITSSESTQITIEKGRNIYYYGLDVEPYGARLWVEASDEGVVDAEFSYGSTLSLTGLQEGSTTLTVRGSTGETITLDVTVTASPQISWNMPDHVMMAVGETMQVTTASSIPALGAPSLTTGDRYVLKVSDTGLLTAVSAGSTYVTMRLGSVYKSANVTVFKPVDGLTLDMTAMRLGVGDTAQVQATDAAGQKVDDYMLIFTSSDTDVAAVSSTGLVTAVAEGEAVLTVSTRDGRQQVTCDIRVGDRLTALNLPGALTAIESEAFMGLKDVEAVRLGAKVASVGARAFANCAGLLEVTISNASCEVDPTAFTGCGPDLVIYVKQGSAAWDTLSAAGLTVRDIGGR